MRTLSCSAFLMVSVLLGTLGLLLGVSELPKSDGCEASVLLVCFFLLS